MSNTDPVILLLRTLSRPIVQHCGIENSTEQAIKDCQQFLAHRFQVFINAYKEQAEKTVKDAIQKEPADNRELMPRKCYAASLAQPTRESL